MDVRVGIIKAIMVLGIAMNKKLYLSTTGARYFLTGRDFLDQTGQNVFEVREGQSPGFFVLASTSKAIFPTVRPASHTYMNQQMGKKKKLADLLGLEKVTMPAYSIFVGHEYLYQRGYGQQALTTYATSPT